MADTRRWPALAAFGGVVAIVAAIAIASVLRGAGGSDTAQQARPVPVAVAPIETGRIERHRMFTGTLEAGAQFVVAPKVGGRLEHVDVELGDAVERGQVVARLDDAEFEQTVAEAKAQLAVTSARQLAARKSEQIARRDFARVRQLNESGVASGQELDAASSAKLEAEAAVAVASAEVKRAAASLETARIRRGYTQVTADWPEGDALRVVGARYADEGEMVAQNARLLSIVDLDPLTVVVFATEKDYADLSIGQAVRLTTDAYPGQTFAGTVARIAPVFEPESRQARVELHAENSDARLRPGMFVRAVAVLDHDDAATHVPADALVNRDGQKVVFVLEGGNHVRMFAVETGIRQADRVQVIGAPAEGRVVVLGQHQLQDGSRVVIPDEQDGPS